MHKIQELHLELLKATKFHNISGEKIVADLLLHQGLWCAVFVEYKWCINLKLEPSQYWDHSSIFIFTVPGRENALRCLAESWNPDDMAFTGEDNYWRPMEEEPFSSCDDEVLKNPKLFLELWWDTVPWPPPGFRLLSSPISKDGEKK